MHVAVIGAGATGLCAARHLSASNSGFTCVVYEQTNSVGGTWVYSEDTGKDKYGLPICSAMYKNLRTNLSTINMEFPGFPFINSKSFVSAVEVLKYLDDYSNHYDIKKHIKFLHHIKLVIPKNKKWQITSTFLPNDREITEEFDAVMICNGHYSVPDMGDFPGISEFEGEVKHSHTYRTPESYTNKTVLICGAGPSGIDISFDLASLASKVYFSHRSNFKPDTFPIVVEQVPVVKEVKNDHVVFVDGTISGHIDSILLCTGYSYSYPFLSPECGIVVDDGKFIQPLYKHMININHPTMCFIGLLFRTFLFPLFDFQVRFFLKTLLGELDPVSREDMYAEFTKDILQKQKDGVPLKKYHEIGFGVRSYIEDLSTLANLGQLAPVVYNVYLKTYQLRKSHLANYRDAVFRTIDEEHFSMSGLIEDEQVGGGDGNTTSS